MEKDTKEKKKFNLKSKKSKFIRFSIMVLALFWISKNIYFETKGISAYIIGFTLSILTYDLFSYSSFSIFWLISYTPLHKIFYNYKVVSVPQKKELLYFCIFLLFINFLFMLLKYNDRCTNERIENIEKNKQAYKELKEKLALMTYKDFYNIKKEIQHSFKKEYVYNIIQYKENIKLLESNLDFISITNSQKLKYFVDILNIYNFYKDKINQLCNNNNFKNFLVIDKGIPGQMDFADYYSFYRPSLKNCKKTRSMVYLDKTENLENQREFFDAYGLELDFYYLVDNYISIIKNKYSEMLNEAIITRRGIEGENEVLNTLKKYNNGSYQILENIRLKSYNTNIANTSETDAIIISKKGIFVLEIKNYGDNGNYTLVVNKDGRWAKQYNNGNIVPIEKSPELQNIEHANTIKQFLKEVTGREFFVYGMVVISNNNVNIINNRDYPVLRKEFVIPEIEKYNNVLNEKEINDIVINLRLNNMGEGSFSVINYRKELIDIIQQFYWELNNFFAQKEVLIKNIFDFYISKVKELDNAEEELQIFKEKKDNYTLDIFEMKMKDIFKYNYKIYSIEKDKSLSGYKNSNIIEKSRNTEEEEEEEPYINYNEEENTYREQEDTCCMEDPSGTGEDYDWYYYYSQEEK